MIKYYLYALAYKMLASNAVTHGLYRFLGNTFGDRLHSRRGLTQSRVGQSRRTLDLLTRYIKKGDLLLELGTGWFHWHSVFVRLFRCVGIDLFDVSDNRQIKTLQRFLSQLPVFLNEEEKAVFNYDLLRNVQDAKSFDEIYSLLGFRYIVDKKGSLGTFANGKYDIVFSSYVFEHIKKHILNDYMKDISRVLKPGGYSVHVFDIADHYSYKDKKYAHRKQYLAFSDRRWRRYFENDIYYINRMQRSEWLKLFEEAGFELIHCDQEQTTVDGLKVHQDYARVSSEDLKCIHLAVVLRKP